MPDPLTDKRTLWIFMSSAAGLLVPDRRWAVRAVIGCGVCYVIFSLTGHVDRTDFLLNLLPTVVVGLAMVGLRRQVSLMNELRQARAEVAGLAANEERLRLARDMHDLTGQSLSIITLKSERAARLLTMLPPSQEKDRVRDEVEQVAAVSRRTGHRPGPRGRRAERGRQPAHPPRGGRAGGQPRWRRDRRDRRRALPVRRHGP
jgi:signal transduction histidine kinase